MGGFCDSIALEDASGPLQRQRASKAQENAARVANRCDINLAYRWRVTYRSALRRHRPGRERIWMCSSAAARSWCAQPGKVRPTARSGGLLRGGVFLRGRRRGGRAVRCRRRRAQRAGETSAAGGRDAGDEGSGGDNAGNS